MPTLAVASPATRPADRSVGRVRLAVALALVAITVGGTLPTPLYGVYADRLGFTTATATVVYGAYAAGTLAALLLFGRLSDVLGRRPLILAAAGLGTASSFVFVVADGLAALIAARIVSGLSVATAAGAVTAYLVDVAPLGDRGSAARISTSANLGGLALGPLLAGVLADVAPWPTRLAFAVHLALLAASAALALRLPETVARREQAPLRPQRLAVPAAVRATFASAAAATAAAFAVLGLFAGLAARFVGGQLGSASLTLVGVAVLAVFGAAATAQLAAGALGPARALRLGLAALPAGLAVLVVSLVAADAALFVAAALIAGVGAGLSFSAALASLGAAAPPDRRAEVISTLFVVAYAAMSVPVVGVGLAAQHVGLATATYVLAALTAATALTVLATTRRSPS